MATSTTWGPPMTMDNHPDRCSCYRCRLRRSHRYVESPTAFDYVAGAARAVRDIIRMFLESEGDKS